MTIRIRDQDAPADGESVVLWSLDERRFAVPLAVAIEVTTVAAITEDPGGGSRMGHLDLRGESVPAFDARRLLAIRDRPVMLSDRYLIARVRRGSIALLVDSVDGIGVARPEPAEGGNASGGSALRLARVDGDGARPLVHVVDLDALIGAPA